MQTRGVTSKSVRILFEAASVERCFKLWHVCRQVASIAVVRFENLCLLVGLDDDGVPCQVRRDRRKSLDGEALNDPSKRSGIYAGRRSTYPLRFLLLYAVPAFYWEPATPATSVLVKLCAGHYQMMAVRLRTGFVWFWALVVTPRG